MKSYVVCPDCGTVFGVAEKIENRRFAVINAVAK